jgi:hypothetical protein
MRVRREAQARFLFVEENFPPDLVARALFYGFCVVGEVLVFFRERFLL